MESMNDYKEELESSFREINVGDIATLSKERSSASVKRASRLICSTMHRALSAPRI